MTAPLTPRERVDALERDERHNTAAETRYWLKQYKLTCRQLAAELEWANRKMEGMIARSSSFADDLNDAICAKMKANDRAEAAERQRDRLQGVQVELCATLLRAESAERDARSLAFDLQYANNQLARYREKYGELE